MVNQEVLGGLHSALQRGESLGEATSSFLAAGYSQREVEEAVAMLNGRQQVNTTQVFRKQTPQGNKITDNLSGLQPQEQRSPQLNMQNAPQKVSSYGQQPNNNRILTILLSVLLSLVIVAGILTVFLFKESILDFFSKLF